jgi:4-hydroxy-tetrahydrodipicolinate reductase
METAIYIQGSRGRMGRMLAAVMQEGGLKVEEKLAEADVAIDFSGPAALKTLLEQCGQLKKPVVIGTTGHTPENEKAMEEMAREIPVFFAPNFSLGMAACVEAAKLMAAQLKGLAHIEIVESHHIHKKDKPSGAAIVLGKATGTANIHSIRAGDTVGDHTIIFVLPGERIELRHQAYSRAAFAKGALLAAQFIKTKPPGFYTMKDLICTL